MTGDFRGDTLYNPLMGPLRVKQANVGVAVGIYDARHHHPSGGVNHLGAGILYLPNFGNPVPGDGNICLVDRRTGAVCHVCISN